MNALKKSIPVFKLKTGLTAGFDGRSYCLQGCVTQTNQCDQRGEANCDLLLTSCLNDCTANPVILT